MILRTHTYTPQILQTNPSAQNLGWVKMAAPESEPLHSPILSSILASEPFLKGESQRLNTEIISKCMNNLRYLMALPMLQI